MAHRDFSLYAVLTTVVVLLVVTATATLGAGAYVTLHSTLDRAWGDLADGMTERTMHETSWFLAGADSAVRLANASIRDGILDPDDHDAMLAYTTRVLDTSPRLTWVSWVDHGGNLLGTFRAPGLDGTIETRRALRIFGPETWKREWRRDPAGWSLALDVHEPYDPRLRPYWVAAQPLVNEGTWTDPYLFTNRGQAGVSYVFPTRDATGTLIGVWTADFECGPLSDFLATLKVGETGRVYLLNQAGQVIAHPEGQVARNGEVERADSHPDAMLRTAWTALAVQTDPTQPFEVGPWLAMARAFPPDTGIPWTVLIVVPSAELFGDASRQLKFTGLLMVLVALIAVLIGSVFAKNLSRSVQGVVTEMERIARFELSDVALTDQRSWFNEINTMSYAHDRMKHGLRSFGRYVPRQLVAQLLRTGQEAKLGGEQLDVSVLFTDINGFTTIVEQTPPDILLATLSDYLTELNTLIAAENGTVAQYLGDAIMAFWGAPEHTPDHALRAARAALTIRQAVADLMVHAPDKGHPPLPTRIGINTGPCIVGNIGAKDRFNYTILGDTVNATSRLEGLNKIYGTTILLGATTAKAIEDHLLIRPVDFVRVKGRHQVMMVYELLGTLDTADDETRADIARYTSALQLYRERSFAEAAERFATTPWAEPLQSRSLAYAAHPPSQDWDGVHTMQTK